MLSPSAREGIHYRRCCSLSTQRRRGRASDPFFFAAVPSPTEPRPKNLKVYFTYSTCIALAACIP